MSWIEQQKGDTGKNEAVSHYDTPFVIYSKCHILPHFELQFFSLVLVKND